MSGDTQAKKRKDKKRKKDDEDTVKETTVHAPKQPSAGAAQAAKEPGDVQMHIQSDHGTGGHWCAKVVFFILLAGLGALIGLIIMENQGVSNEDTPLSESRYSEFFNGWVDENRQDDHHHDEVLAAINSLDDHDDEGDAHHAVEDHDGGDDDGHDQDGDDDDHDDGANDQTNAVDDDDNDDDDNDDDDNDDDEKNEETVVGQDNDDDNDQDEDDDNDDDQNDKNEAEDETDNGAVTGDTLKDQMDELVRNYNKLAESLDVPKVEEVVDVPDTIAAQDANDVGDEEEILEVTRGSQPANDDDDDDVEDDDAAFSELVDNDGGEEEYLEKLRAEQQRRAAAEEERRAAAEPEEETSQKPTNQSDDKSNPKVANVRSDGAVAANDSVAEQKNAPNVQTTATKTVLDDFVYAGPTEQLLSEQQEEVIEDNVIIFDDNDDAERYSGDDYEYELDELEEAEEEAEPEEDAEEQLLIKQEQEIGAFVPITFEDFSSMYRAPAEPEAVPLQSHQEAALPVQPPPPSNERHSSKKTTKDSLLARSKPPKGAFNKLIYGLHKDPIVIPPDGTEQQQTGAAPVERGENVSAKGEAKTVLTALLAEIPSPPVERVHEHHLPKLVVPPAGTSPGRARTPSPSGQRAARERHVEFLLPEREQQPEFELDEPAEFELERSSPAGDNGSKENLFVPDTSEEEELEPNEYAEEYSTYAEEQDEEELVYEEEEELIDDIDSVLLNQYGSDEEEEPLTDDNIPPGGDDEEEASDVDDTDLMRRLEEKYGKLPATGSAALPEATPTEGNDEEDEATAAGWTKIPSRAEEADRSYQEELRRAEQQLDENKPQEALAAFDRILLRTPNSIDALIGRARSLDALAEQRRSNAILTEAIAAYRKVIEHELSVDDGTLKTVAERCIDRMRFQGQHAQAIEVHNVLIRRFDNEPLYRNQLAVSYLYLNRLAEAKAVLHETLLRWIDNGFALVHYGFVLKTLDQNMELAAQYLQEGIETGHPGTQDGRFYFQLGDALQRLGRNSEALAVYRKGVQKKLFRSVYQRSLYNVDGLAARPYWTEEQTTYATELELIRAKWREVRDEGLKLLTSAGVFVNESENLRDRGDWKQLELFSRGARVERNCARAPYTCRLVEQYFPAARTCKRGQVKFSVMHPGTHVWPHCGPTNCRVRAHLGLRVPPGTYIRVAQETRSWENGKWLIFDDSFEHEVWHNGTETRLVLIVDFWHPELTESQRRTLSPI
uniref:Aspartyl/asparaginy/proline hydroxylase domain-containing protein n=1 Tax=Anopheles merus TaxID=30066 RepID=A0A182V3U1_ANOME